LETGGLADPESRPNEEFNEEPVVGRDLREQLR
jgi:hypothetical protein